MISWVGIPSGLTAFPLAKEYIESRQLLNRVLESRQPVLGPLVEAFGNVRVELQRFSVQEGEETPNLPFMEDFKAPQQLPCSSLIDCSLRSRFPSKFIVLGVRIKTILVAFPYTCFKFANVGPEEVQHRQPCELSRDFCLPSSRPFKVCICWGLRRGSSSPPLPVTILCSCQPASQGTPTLQCVRAIRPRCRLGRDRKHGVS